jgi:hypothetical protein
MHNQIASFRAALDARPVSRYQWLILLLLALLLVQIVERLSCLKKMLDGRMYNVSFRNHFRNLFFKSIHSIVFLFRESEFCS